MWHRPLGICLALLISSIVGKTLVLPRCDDVPRDIVMEEEIRDGCGEEARLGGRYADLLRGGATSGNVALEEGVTPGDALEGGVWRGG